MASDFELRRLTDKLKKLSEEQVRVNQQILKSRRDEQRELDLIRRRFNNVIHNLEENQKRITKQTEVYERQLVNLENKMADEKEQDHHSATSANRRHNHYSL